MPGTVHAPAANNRATSASTCSNYTLWPGKHKVWPAGLACCDLALGMQRVLMHAGSQPTQHFPQPELLEQHLDAGYFGAAPLPTCASSCACIAPSCSFIDSWMASRVLTVTASSCFSCSCCWRCWAARAACSSHQALHCCIWAVSRSPFCRTFRDSRAATPGQEKSHRQGQDSCCGMSLAVPDARDLLSGTNTTGRHNSLPHCRSTHQPRNMMLTGGPLLSAALPCLTMQHLHGIMPSYIVLPSSLPAMPCLTVRSSPANLWSDAGPQRTSSSPRRAGASNFLASGRFRSHSLVVGLPCR